MGKMKSILFTTIPLIGLALACGSRPPVPGPAPLASPPAPDSGARVEADRPCPTADGEHSIFAIAIDGVDVGREVRTETVAEGPLGRERVAYAHSVVRMRFLDTLLETRESKSQRTLLDSGMLLEAAHVIVDQVKTRSFLVGYNGQGWDRLADEQSAAVPPPAVAPGPLGLTGREIIGRRLLDRMRDAALGLADQAGEIAYYEPLLEAPVPLVLAALPAAGADVDGQEIAGRWVEARRRDSNQLLLRAFFDQKGVLWIEEYPLLGQVRRRVPGPLSVSADPSELLVGLYSKAYLADPNQATDATFVLRAAPERLDRLGLLGDPSNQSLLRKSPGELVLQVKAGSPDGDDPPDASDLGPSKYVQPDAPAIVQALRYLRSAGTSGRLPRPRIDNATTAVARAALIRNPGRFWSDPEKAAGLLMYYVTALIPDKRHTFAISTAVDTLAEGKGDCTEHAVLFASLMRAQGIPTRLVTGLYLTAGGIWGYHMWNSYWDGAAWRAIDPSTMTPRPGAVYVAIGRGAAAFEDVRDRLSDFMARTFSGVTFDLVAASNEGESLLLARPANPGPGLGEAALVNAIVLSDRGDHAAAIAVLDHAIPDHLRTLPIELLRTELLVRSGRHGDALGRIAALRLETRDEKSLALLDDFELDCLLAIGLRDRASALFHRMEERLSARGDRIALSLVRAKYLHGAKEDRAAVAALDQALSRDPEEPRLLSRFADYVASGDDPALRPLLTRALAAAELAVRKTRFADAETLTVLSRVLFRSGRPAEASWLLDHAFVLAPSDRALHQLRASAAVLRCR